MFGNSEDVGNQFVPLPLKITGKVAIVSSYAERKISLIDID